MPEKSVVIIEIPPVVTLVGATVPSCTYLINGKSETSTLVKTL